MSMSSVFWGRCSESNDCFIVAGYHYEPSQSNFNIIKWSCKMKSLFIQMVDQGVFKSRRLEINNNTNRVKLE